MKNVFEFHKDSDEYAGLRFISLSLEDDEITVIDDYNKLLEENKKLWQIPLYLRIIQGITAILAIIAIVSIIRSEVTLGEAFSNAPYIFIGGGISLIAAVAITLFAKLRERNYFKGEEFAKLCKIQDEISSHSKKRLSIPENAEMIDVLASYREVKNGAEVNALACDFVPSMMYSYVDEENLYLADCSASYSFPRSSIVGIKEIKDKITLSEWHKDTPHSAEEYKPYKITVDAAGFVHVKSFFSLILNDAGEELEILFPPYDIDVISSLLEIPVNTNE